MGLLLLLRDGPHVYGVPRHAHTAHTPLTPPPHGPAPMHPPRYALFREWLALLRSDTAPKRIWASTASAQRSCGGGGGDERKICAVLDSCRREGVRVKREDGGNGREAEPMQRTRGRRLHLHLKSITAALRKEGRCGKGVC